MTKEELLAPFKDVHLKRQHESENVNEIYPTAYDDHVRTILKDESCTSNRLGADDESILEWLCYDAGQCRMY